MAYRLAPHLSFCRTAGGTVLLDLQADRYSLLPPPLAEGLAACESGAPPEAAADPGVRRLLSLGLLIADPQGSLKAVRHSSPTRSVL